MPPRNRLVYVGLAALTIFIGLTSRAARETLGPGFTKYLGDALYALLVFWLVALIWRKQTSGKIALAALAICYAIELTQLYHTDWLDRLRDTLPGRLILGAVFNWPDFIAYTGGGLAGFALDWRFRRCAAKPV